MKFRVQKDKSGVFIAANGDKFRPTGPSRLMPGSVVNGSYRAGMVNLENGENWKFVGANWKADPDTLRNLQTEMDKLFKTYVEIKNDCVEVFFEDEEELNHGLEVLWKKGWKHPKVRRHKSGGASVQVKPLVEETIRISIGDLRKMIVEQQATKLTK